jgi:hypothetical protein
MIAMLTWNVDDSRRPLTDRATPSFPNGWPRLQVSLVLIEWFEAFSNILQRHQLFLIGQTFRYCPFPNCLLLPRTSSCCYRNNSTAATTTVLAFDRRYLDLLDCHLSACHCKVSMQSVVPGISKRHIAFQMANSSKDRLSFCSSRPRTARTCSSRSCCVVVGALS